MDLEEVDKNAKVVGKYARRFLLWTAKNEKRRIAVFLLISALLWALFVGGISWLQYKSDLDFTHKEQERQWIHDENRFQTSIDAISLCTDPMSPKELKGWYCEVAAVVYHQQATNTVPPDRIEDVVKRKAFGAMKLDLTNAERRIKLDRANKTEPAPETKLLQILTSEIVWVAAVHVSLLILAMLLLNHAPKLLGENNSKDNND